MKNPELGIGASVRAEEPDAHGQAALLLAESTLHMLVEARALTLEQAGSVVRTAAEVKVEVATLAGESKGRMNESLALLARIGASLASDESGPGDGRVPEPL